MSIVPEVDRTRAAGTVEDQTVDSNGRVKSMPTRDDGSDADLRTLYQQASDGGFSGTFSDFLEHLRTATTVEDIDTDGSGAAKAAQVDENGDIITPDSGRLPSVLYDAQGQPVDVSSLVAQGWQATDEVSLSNFSVPSGSSGSVSTALHDSLQIIENDLDILDLRFQMNWSVPSGSFSRVDFEVSFTWGYRDSELIAKHQVNNNRDYYAFGSIPEHIGYIASNGPIEYLVLKAIPIDGDVDVTDVKAQFYYKAL